MIIMVFFSSLVLFYQSFSNNFSYDQYITKDIKLDIENNDLYYFPLPTSIEYDSDKIFILDAEDNEIRIFSKSGTFKYSIGRKGQGPGEFNFPTDMAIYKKEIYVADKLNRRIQILDKKGNYIGGFKVLFSPQKILVLGTDKILVSHLPSRPSGKEKMLYCFNHDGKLLWKNVDSYFSKNNIYDVFRNRIFFEKGENEHFFLIRQSNDRYIYLHDNNSGDMINKIKVEEVYSFKKIYIPTKPKMELQVFCEFFTLNNGKFFLLTPDYIEHEGEIVDVGPGKRVVIINWEGRIQGYIDLPERFKKFCIDDKNIYGIDKENNLRILNILKK